jgi:hypothetical protein
MPDQAAGTLAESGGWLGIGTASFLADVGHEIPTALLPNLLAAILGALAAALGLIEGISDGLAGAARLAGGALADDPPRRRAQAVGGYTTTAILSSLIGAAITVWQVGILRAGAWAARGLRVPASNALLADIVPASVYGRAYGFERAWTTSAPSPGRCSPWPGRHPDGHRVVGHPRAAGRPRHRLRHPPGLKVRTTRPPTAAPPGPAGPGRPAGAGSWSACRRLSSATWPLPCSSCAHRAVGSGL